MRLKIDGCVGCGFCYLIWRDWFCHQSGYGEKAAVRDVEIPEEDRDEVNKAINQCPGRAISIIDAEKTGLAGEEEGPDLTEFRHYR